MKLKRLNVIKEAVLNYQKTNIYKKLIKYDLFSELKIKVSEDVLSNIIADIINPIKSPFGKNILLRLLRETDKDELIKIFKKVDNANIIVKREQHGENSRIDIRIYTNLPQDNIVIDIEMKVGCGSETTHKSGKLQTERELVDLYTFADQKGIPRNNVVAYFITPNAKIANCRNFTSLSLYDLNEVILEELKIYNESELICSDGISACRHFFSSRWIF